MTEKNVQADVKKYELMVIVNPDIGTAAIAEALEEIKKLLTAKKSKGELFFEDVWGIRDLAYPIKKHDAGYYAVYDFVMLPSGINEIDQTLRLDNNIVRHMIVNLPLKYAPKTFAQMEAERAVEAEKEAASKPARRGSKPPVREVKPEAAKAEVKEENPVVKAKTNKADASLAEVDAKLKSIIDNPDINF